MADGPGPSFLEELKRRKVVRVAAVYGATVFAVLQVADLLVEPLSLPGWTMRMLVLLGAAGFPVAVGLAWVFEVRPEGLRRTAPADADAAERSGSASLLSRRSVVAVAVLLAVGFAAGRFFAPAATTGAEGGDAARTTGPAQIRSNGIAVLPFASRSTGGADADFFAAGLHDDLLTQLAGLEELVVISRTSVEQYRDTEKSIPTIGRELGVAYVLEGGVQQAGDRLRVNAQLIDARSDEHLWAETLDGDLTVSDIFAIQEELAGRIVEAMETTLTGDLASRLAAAPTESLQAWEAMTRGRDLWSRNDLPGAERAFEDAVTADPGFAEAWAWVAVVRSQSHWFGSDRADAAREALSQALVLAPAAALTDWAEAFYEYYVLQAYPGALQSIEGAVRKAPGRAELHWGHGLLLRRVGDFPGAMGALGRALELDPRNGVLLSALIWTAAKVGDYEAVAHWTDALLDLPDLDPTSVGYALIAQLERGRFGHVRRVAERLDPALRDLPRLRILLLGADLLDPSIDPPPSEAIRATLTEADWAGEEDDFLSPLSSLIVPADPDREHLEFLLAGLDRRLARGAGAQQEAIDRSNRAHVLALLGRRAEAEADARSALAWIRRTDDRNVGGTLLYNLALTFEALGERGRAVSLLEEAAPMWTFPVELLRLDPAAADLVRDPAVEVLLRNRRPKG